MLPDPDAINGLNSPSSPRQPIRGRDSELRIVDHLLAKLAAGGSGLLLVRGTPGSGKTRLLDEIGDVARGRGIRPFNAGGVAQGHPNSFEPLFSKLSDEVEPTNGGVKSGAASSAEHRFRDLEALLTQLEQTATGSTLIMVDDLQRCDSATLLALRTLPFRLTRKPVLWVVTYRDVAADHEPFAQIRDDFIAGGATELVLHPLPAQAIRDVIGDAIGAMPDDHLVDSIVASEQYPLQILELLTGLVESGEITIDRGQAHRTGRDVSPAFSDSVGSSITTLSVHARRVLEAGAAAGRTFSPSFAAAMLDIEIDELDAPLLESVNAGLLVVRDQSIDFVHDLIRDVVTLGMSENALHKLRCLAVQVQIEQGGDVLELASMLAYTAQPGDLGAVELLRRATKELASVAPEHALELSLRALELSDALYPGRARLAADAVTLLWQAGQPGRARAVGESELARANNDEEQAHLRLGLARALGQFSLAEAVRQCRIAVQLPNVSFGLRDRIQALLSLNLTISGIPDTDTVLPSGYGGRLSFDDATAATVSVTRSVLEFDVGDWTASFSSMQEAMILADRAGMRYSTFAVEGTWAGLLTTATGNIAEALLEADRGIAEGRRLRQVAAVRVWGMVRSRILLDAGRLPDAAADAQAVLDAVDELGTGNLADATAMYTLARVALYEAKLTDIDRFVNDATRLLDDEAPLIRSVGAWILCLVEDSRGNPADAIGRLRAAIDDIGESGPSLGRPADPADEVILVRIALRAGARADAECVLQFMELRAARNPSFAVLRATTLHARALIHDDRNALSEAVILFESMERPLVLASALEDLGRMTLRHSESAAVLCLNRALGLYDTSGAKGSAERVRARLVAAAATGLADAPATGRWGSLSPSQRRVVKLVVSGLTNDQTAAELRISTHTVNTHLRVAFRKLGVHTRVDLARVYFETGNS